MTRNATKLAATPAANDVPARARVVRAANERRALNRFDALWLLGLTVLTTLLWLGLPVRFKFSQLQLSQVPLTLDLFTTQYLAQLQLWLHNGFFSTHGVGMGAPWAADISALPRLNWGMDGLTWVIAKATGNAVLALNAVAIINVALSALAAAALARGLGLSRGVAALVALLFALSPYAQMQGLDVAHSAVWVVAAWLVLLLKVQQCAALSLRRWAMMGVSAIALAFTVHSYAVLALILSFAAIATAVWQAPQAPIHSDSNSVSTTPRWRHALPALSLSVVIALSLTASRWVDQQLQTPSMVQVTTPVNSSFSPERIPPHPASSEIHGLKFIQLLLPRPDHRSDALAEVAHNYARGFPLVNDNQSAALGAVAALGWLGLLLWALWALLQRSRRALSSPVDPTDSLKPPQNNSFDSNLMANYPAPLGLWAAWVIWAFLWATIAGLASLWALWVDAQFDDWYRMAVFISLLSFLVIGALLEGLRQALEQRLGRWGRWLAVLLLLLMIALGLWDQTPKSCKTCAQDLQTQWTQDAAFFKSLNDAVAQPAPAMVLQWPYLPAPEADLRAQAAHFDYAPLQLGKGFVHVPQIRWSHGGAAAGQGDHFYRLLDHAPLADQLNVAKAMEFTALTVDAQGFCDAPDALQTALRQAGATEIAAHANGHLRAYRLPTASAQDLSAAQTVLEGMGYALPSAAGAAPTPLPLSQPLSLDFRRPPDQWPAAVASVQGLTNWATTSMDSARTERLAPLRLHLQAPRCVKLRPLARGDEPPTPKAADPDGLWMDGLRAKHVRIDWAAPLPPKVRTSLTVRATGPNVGQALTVQLGKQTQRATLKAGWQTVQLDFKDVPPHAALRLTPAQYFFPYLKTPADSDYRLVGLQLQNLTIVPLE